MLCPWTKNVLLIQKKIENPWKVSHIFGDAIEVASLLTRIKNRWSNFRDSLSLLTSKVLAFEAKGRLHSSCLGSVMLIWG